jgi:hypothetical protein
MTATRIQQPEDLGFEWEPLALARKERLAELKSFRYTHGHCLVQQRYLRGDPAGEGRTPPKGQGPFRPGRPSHSRSRGSSRLGSSSWP